MRQYWQKLALRIDAMSLRERTIVFGLAALVVLTLVNETLIDPQFRQQKALAAKLAQEQAKIAEIQTQIQKKSALQAIDPNLATREQLKKVTQEAYQMQLAFGDLQKGLVPPDRMAELLEGILARHGKLRLLSLKTLAPSGMTEATSAASTDKAVPAPAQGVAAKADGAPPASSTPASSIYKHGVELVVQGSYEDMVRYMAELERMPWQVFWGKAALDSSEYSKATLTLTLYTLSMDKQWLNL